MKKVCAMFLVLGVVAAALPACRSGTKESREQERAAKEAAMLAAIPADSPLSKLGLGMSEGEVTAILGMQTSMDSHTTGKEWIPFNFAGKDILRTVYYYKGVGRVEFSAGSWGQRNGVINIEHDPSEPGYRRTR